MRRALIEIMVAGMVFAATLGAVAQQAALGSQVAAVVSASSIA